MCQWRCEYFKGALLGSARVSSLSSDITWMPGQLRPVGRWCMRECDFSALALVLWFFSPRAGSLVIGGREKGFWNSFPEHMARHSQALCC